MAEETLRIVAMDKCRDCEGTGERGDDGDECERACFACDGEGVTERQVGLEELAVLLMPHLRIILACEGAIL